MKITIEIDDHTIKELRCATHTRKTGLAVGKAIAAFLHGRKAREFGRMLMEGHFDYSATNDSIELKADR